MNRELTALFIIFILAGLSFAETAQTTGQQLLTGALGSKTQPAWFPLFAIFLIMGYLIAGIAYMLSTVFKLQDLTAWAKMEVAEVTASAFLVLIVLMALGMSDAVFFAATGKTPMQTSITFTETISNKLFGVYLESVYLSTAVGTLIGAPPQFAAGGSTKITEKMTSAKQSLSSNLFPKEPGGMLRFFIVALFAFDVRYNPFWAAQTFMGHFGTVQSIALTSVFVSTVSHLFLIFIQNVAIPVLVPFGFFLSMFSGTRKMGRTLIAFGVGMYIFLPAGVLISEQMYNSAYKSGIYPPEINMPDYIRSFSNQLWALQLSQIAMGLLGMFFILLPHVGGSLIYAIPCLIGSALMAIVCLIGYPACFAAFYSVCMGFTRPFVDFPLATGFSLVMFKDFLTYLRLITLSGILGVAGSNVGLLLVPITVSTVALVINLIWPAIPPGPEVPNLAMMIMQIVSFISTPLGSIMSFLVHVNLEAALAAKLSDIALDFTPYVLQYAVPIMLMPIVMIVVVVTAIRSISPAIGGEVQILGVSELI